MMGELTNDWQARPPVSMTNLRSYLTTKTLKSNLFLLQQKWQQQTTILERGGLELKESGSTVVVESELPHLISLQLDDIYSSGTCLTSLNEITKCDLLQMTGVTFYYLKSAKSTVGAGSCGVLSHVCASQRHLDGLSDIIVDGAGMEPQHCFIEHDKDQQQVLLTPQSQLCFINNEQVRQLRSIV